MNDSIFRSAVRAFFISLMTVIGIIAAIVVFTLIIAAVSNTATEPDRIYTQEVVANANGTRKEYSSSKPVILQLNIDGVIGMEQLTMDAVRRQLMESREGDLKDNPPKAIFLRINSPGGTVVDADGIYHAIKTYKEQYSIPVYAYVDGLCASGGMYVACSADKVFASDISLVGSIGVISPAFFNVHETLEKIGVHSLTLSAGKGKDELNPLRPWKPGEQDNLLAIINAYYESFVNLVTTNRPEVNKTKLVGDYGAKIFIAKEAQEIGFVNLAGYNRADSLKQLLKHIGIEDDHYQVVELGKKTWYESLFGSNANMPAILSGKITHKIQLTPDLDPQLANQFLYLYHPGS